MEIQAHARDSVRDAKTGALRKELQALKQKEESSTICSLWIKYIFEKGGSNTISDEKLKTGQVSMDVNPIPGLVLDTSKDEGGEVSGDVNAIQN